MHSQDAAGGQEIPQYASKKQHSTGMQQHKPIMWGKEDKWNESSTFSFVN